MAEELDNLSGSSLDITHPPQLTSYR